MSHSIYLTTVCCSAPIGDFDPTYDMCDMVANASPNGESFRSLNNKSPTEIREWIEATVINLIKKECELRPREPANDWGIYGALVKLLSTMLSLANRYNLKAKVI